MNLVGLRLAFEKGVSLALPESSSMLLATVPTIALLKMAAYRDRPEERERDLDDLAFLLEDYLGDEDDRRFLLIEREPKLDYENASAFALGLDVGEIVNDEERAIVTDQVLRLNAHPMIDRELSDHADEPRNAWDRFLYWALRSYVNNIRRYAGKRRPGGYTCFRRAQLVGPTNHHLAMVLAGLLVQVSPMVYLAYFFISLVPANLYLLMVLRLAPPLADEESAVSEAVTS
jgi:hypothetical protein